MTADYRLRGGIGASLMDNNFIEVNDAGEFGELLAQSNEGPVILFKHSDVCGVSERAYAQMAAVSAPVMLVVVQAARELSNEIEERTGIEHASPQAIVFRNGKPVWWASHRQITAEALTKAVQENR